MHFVGKNQKLLIVKVMVHIVTNIVKGLNLKKKKEITAHSKIRTSMPFPRSNSRNTLHSLKAHRRFHYVVFTKKTNEKQTALKF
jgi:hypothetical protein